LGLVSAFCDLLYSLLLFLLLFSFPLHTIFCRLFPLFLGFTIVSLTLLEVTGHGRELHRDRVKDLRLSRLVIQAVKDNTMGGSCGTYGGEERCM
jgi:hypothetical protein